VTCLENAVVFPPEPPVAVLNSPEWRAADKGARQRGEADPCRRAPFWHFTTLDGRRCGNTAIPAGELEQRRAHATSMQSTGLLENAAGQR
jgi:hypothetical protein